MAKQSRKERKKVKAEGKSVQPNRRLPPSDPPMPPDQSEPDPAKMSEEGRRSNFITWGVGLVTIFLAWLFGIILGKPGAAGATCIGAVGIALLLRGHFPHWFHGPWMASKAWSSAIILALIAGGTAWKIFPESKGRRDVIPKTANIETSKAIVIPFKSDSGERSKENAGVSPVSQAEIESAKTKALQTQGAKRFVSPPKDLASKEREAKNNKTPTPDKDSGEKPLSDANRSAFIDRLKAHSGQRDKVEFACATWSEVACAKAGRYLIAFSEASWPLTSETVRRIQLPLPMDGVVIVSRSQAPAGLHLPPHRGWWTRADESSITIRFAFQEMGITMRGSTDLALAADSLIIFFGPELER